MRSCVDGSERIFRAYGANDELRARVEVARRNYAMLHGDDARKRLDELRDDRLIEGVDHCFFCEGVGCRVSREHRWTPKTPGYPIRQYPIEIGEGSGHYIDEYDVVNVECVECRGVGVLPVWAEVE